jgi:hypothetical protein
VRRYLALRFAGKLEKSRIVIGRARLRTEGETTERGDGDG